MRIPCEPLNMKISVMNKNTAVRKSFSATSGSKVIISIRTPGDEKAEFDDENKSVKPLNDLYVTEVTTPQTIKFYNNKKKGEPR